MDKTWDCVIYYFMLTFLQMAPSYNFAGMEWQFASPLKDVPIRDAQTAGIFPNLNLIDELL
ncbi:MAG: hypothetical protein A3C61_01135 [Candidatus Yanofskybacteria bacterium RIFCSPHIGHO2_02_FULL_39_10]|uniref:Uncharacterized protein n=1 Tax=Candidatus Yanofskybacteria bacterium RIFCSPHIGHO2_02_FULL_39_10 TaxID=1802674 RepID=A0A1F8F4M4_9BACT|nr:MAG: hypothetical protein A3C61_01135 [Candidatus Yanofskybacteria bacterium RIFCSPHIGHO2_02_FULL_39_10]